MPNGKIHLSSIHFHFDSWNPSLNMMISSVHLNQRFWKNLSCLRALVSQRRKSHKGWQRRFIDIYVDIYMLFRILLLYDGQYQEMVHTKFSVLSMWLRFSITDQFPFYQFIVGASARTLWYWYHRLIFRTCLIPIFRANSLLTHRLQDTQDGQCPLEGIFFHHRDRRCSSGTWERLESLKAAEYFNSSLTAQLSTLLAAGCFPPWASLPDRCWVYRGKQRIQRMVGVSKYECDVKSYQWNLASLTLIGWW